MPHHAITPKELQKMQQDHMPFTLIDVREPDEFAICNLGGMLIPLAELAERLATLDKQQHYVVHCRSGMRSQKAVEMMQAAGFVSARSLQGGIIAWAQEIEPGMPIY